ncbi:MAG: excinuclease ABC subunit UvrA, partial [Muribaculaceae bacterium]|nr:excinuclease ABC subunit UvrA [Muribaculaceae bacterium]
PHNSLTVITGLSGCGKSSLAFDTIFAEGQRRYIETFSAYARNMLGNLERPDVDNITGLSPVISIEQKTVNKNPRSTIGTTTEIYDFFRLLYARLGEARSYISGKPMEKYSKDKIVSLLLSKFSERKIQILAPLIKNRKGHYKELFETLRKKGYLHVRIDGEVKEIMYGMRLDRYKNHSIELVIDRLRVKENDIQRLRSTVEEALKQGNRQMMVLDVDTNQVYHYSQLLMDTENGISYPEPAPHNFSFNSPQGYCEKCKGLGEISIIDYEKIIPDKTKSIYDGGILPLGKYKNTLIFWQIDAICKLYGATLKTPISELPEEAIDDILNGTYQRLDIQNATLSTSYLSNNYEGLVKYLENQTTDEQADSTKRSVATFFRKCTCPECQGKRLNKIALSYFIDDKNIAEISDMDISQLYNWTLQLDSKFDNVQKKIASEVLKEIKSRLQFLLDVGLDYLSLNRNSSSLSGGESQRIRLATQIGSKLVNVLYILDEPSIGLHQRDNIRLINSLKQLRDAGNTIIVVEHDKDIMNEADYIVDIGPGAGRNGGEVMFQGEVAELKKTHTLTASYLTGERKIEIPKIRRSGNGKNFEIIKASGHNLKDVNLTLPLGKFICVTGVSGSGKSSLINGTLHPILAKKLYRSIQEPLPYQDIKGIENIDKVVTVDQSPLGRTPRSNPATYTGVFA